MLRIGIAKSILVMIVIIASGFVALPVQLLDSFHSAVTPSSPHSLNMYMGKKT
jgi:hypothetical protein